VKRNTETVKIGRLKKAGHRSRYAEKVERGQMYGPGCCAHTVSDAQIQAARKKARETGTYKPSFIRHEEPPDEA
jgi:hypothetical protein